MTEDEFQQGTGNWWVSSRNRFGGGTAVPVTPPASISTTLTAVASLVEMKTTSSMMDSGGGGSVDQAAGAGVLGNLNLHMMELRLSSQNMDDWNKAFIRGKKSDHGSFQSLLPEDLSSSTSSFQSEHWRKKLYSGDSSEVESAAAYGLLSAGNLLEQQNRPTNNSYPSTAGGGYRGNTADLTNTCNKYPRFLRASPAKNPVPAEATSGSHLHFTNNTPFWNASADSQSSFPPPALQNNQIFSAAETRDSDSSTTKKNSTETSSSSPLAAFKVRKEKMGDRITALQQLVSPFGKTDTASVLSEAIEYIKFLHQQIIILTMKNGASQHHQYSDKSKDPEEPRQDLRSRELCLVPVSR